jgi:hypothetical protein
MGRFEQPPGQPSQSRQPMSLSASQITAWLLVTTGRPSRASSSEDLLLAFLAAVHRIRGAMERDDVAARVSEGARRLLDARHELVEGEAIGAGHAQARDMRHDARRKG